VPEMRLVRNHAERHAEKVVQAKTGKTQLVMIGDSITHNWERQRNYAELFSPYNTLNLGFGGDRTENVLWRIQNGEIDNISPKLVTMMIGTNNIPKEDSPADIAAGIKAIVAELRRRLPGARIVIFSIFPRNHHRVEGDFEVVQEVNKLLPAIADNKHVFHVDVTQAFLDDSGQPNPTLYGRDLLHLSDQGYATWWCALKPILAEAGLEVDPTESSFCHPERSVAESKDLKHLVKREIPRQARDDIVSGDAPVIRLWPIEMVGGEENRLKKLYRDRHGRKQLCGVIDPYLTVYPVKSDKPTPALVFCPGGAYKILGLPSVADIKKWNDLGLTVFVLKYRIPDQLDEAFQDIQRAVRLVRHQAGTLNVDPEQIGLFGNSAGGHLAARLTQNYDQKVYEPIDDADKTSCEPNFAVLQCAAYFQGRRMDKEFDAELFHMKNKVAPTFLTYAKDDKFCAGGVDYAKRLTEAGRSIRLRLFEKGGHGMEGCDWFSDAAEWMEEQKIVR
jgi:acetyl esterase/lipase/lysophospholipase L1-like esterase